MVRRAKVNGVDVPKVPLVAPAPDQLAAAIGETGDDAAMVIVE